MMNAKDAKEMTMAMRAALEERAKKVAINFAEVACQDAIKFAILKGKTITSLEVPEDIRIDIVIDYLKEHGYLTLDCKKGTQLDISWF